MQVSALKNKLKKQSTATGDGVARAFLRAQAALFGSYRDALRYKPVSNPLINCSDCPQNEATERKRLNITADGVVRAFL